MKHALVAVFAVLAGAPAAIAAEQDFSSPYDNNRQCAERTTDGNAPECVIQDEGTPRQTYAPGTRRPVVPNEPPQTPPTAGPPPTTPPGMTVPLPPRATDQPRLRNTSPGTAATPSGTTTTPTPGSGTAAPGTTTASPASGMTRSGGGNTGGPAPRTSRSSAR